MIPKCSKFAGVTRYTIVIIVPEQHNTQPCAHYWYWPMKTSSEFLLKLHELYPHPFANGMPQYSELSLTGFAAYVSKTEEVKRLRFPLALAFTVLSGKTA